MTSPLSASAPEPLPRTTILDASISVAAETASNPEQVAEVLFIVEEMCNRHLPMLFDAVEAHQPTITVPTSAVADAIMQAATCGVRRVFARRAADIHNAIAKRNPHV